MDLIRNFRQMDKRLRVMLIATLLLLVPQIGQFVTIRDLNLEHHVSGVAILLSMMGIFIIPTSLILTTAIAFALRDRLRTHRLILLLGMLNIIISASLILFLVNQCVWSLAAGIPIHGCVR